MNKLTALCQDKQFVSFDNLSNDNYDFSRLISKETMRKLGFIGRFWSTSKPVTMAKFAANVLCNPITYKDYFFLAGIIGIKPLKEFAEKLQSTGELDQLRFNLFNENLKLVERYFEENKKE